MRNRPRYIKRIIRNLKKPHTKLVIVGKKKLIVPVRKYNLKKLRKVVYWIKRNKKLQIFLKHFYFTKLLFLLTWAVKNQYAVLGVKKKNYRVFYKRKFLISKSQKVIFFRRQLSNTHARIALKKKNISAHRYFKMRLGVSQFLR